MKKCCFIINQKHHVIDIYKLGFFIFGFIMSYFFFLINEFLLNCFLKTHGNKKISKKK